MTWFIACFELYFIFIYHRARTQSGLILNVHARVAWKATAQVEQKSTANEKPQNQKSSGVHSMNRQCFVLQGMGYLHAKGIVHKDLKSKNVFHDTNKVVITDFGLFGISGVVQEGR